VSEKKIKAGDQENPMINDLPEKDYKTDWQADESELLQKRT
jgi:hypothetical protein